MNNDESQTMRTHFTRPFERKPHNQFYTTLRYNQNMDSVFEESEGDVLRLRRIVTGLPADELEGTEEGTDEDDDISKSKVSRLFSSTKDLTSSDFPSAKRMVSSNHKLSHLSD